MVDRALIASKLTDLADRIARVRQHSASTASKLAAHRDASDLVAFNLMLAVHICRFDQPLRRG